MLKDKARTLRQNMTDAEQRLWRCLRRRQVNGHRFRRQVPLGQYVADFVCYDARLVIEIDGGQHLEQAARDLQRDRWFGSQNFRVLRFWNDQVLRETDAVMEVIVRALEVPPPHPSPVKGEGKLVRGADKSCPSHSSPVAGEGEHGIPPPLAGGGEGEG